MPADGTLAAINANGNFDRSRFKGSWRYGRPVPAHTQIDAHYGSSAILDVLEKQML
jgi:hypothetical protein